MNHAITVRIGIAAIVLAVLGLRSAGVLSDPTFTAGSPPTIAQVPLYLRDATPPLNMLVMGKDHKIYYEAYNDASDLNGDGALDIGYRGWELKSPAPPVGVSPYKIDYYGYFNSFACYMWDGAKFTPTTATANKRCSGQWSGDFLNYLTTSRMDALRRVLYGGWRQSDTTTETVLQGAFFPQDAHSWGKEYFSVARDGYDISNYSPLPLPNAGLYHLFAVTTVTGNAATFPAYQAPLFRVMQNTSSRVWNWLSIEGPVAGIKCFSVANTRIDCVSSSGGGTAPFPGNPASRAEFDTLQSTFAIPANNYGSGNVSTINCNGATCNPYGVDDEYLSIFTGTIQLRDANAAAGTYQFRVNGSDAIDFELRQTNGTLITTAGCYGSRNFGACSGGETTAGVALIRNGTYNFTFRQENDTGADGYLLEWRKTSGSSQFAWTPVTTSNADSNNNGSFSGSGPALSTYDLTPTTPVSSGRADYPVRVLTCPTSNPAVRESTCKGYPVASPTVYKPTGILHDYGENQKMYFGLITGSQNNNLEGGVLRRNISDFASEIDPATGQIRTNVEGIVRTIDRLRMIGGGYNGGTTNNLNSDSNWNWANGYGNCPSIGDRAINNGECRMWGNPLAEMMYESLRYFAGAAAPIPRFATGGATQGDTEETAMGLSKPTWKDPYAATPTGLGYPKCAKPFQTLISDINPSYDGDLPGNAFGGATSAGTVPATISAFSASTEGAAIWAAEFGAGPRDVFIGEVAGVTDGAPTAKTASSFGNIRGLAPEEPTKGGTYYSASVARFGRNTDINAVADAQNLGTYSIALASPLPKIEFPLNGRTVTILPFAKTVSGTFGGGVRKPTNTIVDFYVEQIFNFPGQTQTVTVNGGRPYAVFGINYEDVEQGNDHDMDAIVRYTVQVNAGPPQTVTISLSSDYAAGSADQNIGYTISGTNRDGIYLEVKDRDGPGTPYVLNTPPGVWAGGCSGGTTTPPCNANLTNTATRTFGSGTTGARTGLKLNDPLWYAAKYGGDPAWDANGDFVPDNYFLVTNPLQLRAQMATAFDAITDQSVPPGNLGVTGARISGSSFTAQPSFNIQRNSKDWTGDITALRVNPDGSLSATPLWNAQSQLPPATGGLNAGSRNILTSIVPGPRTTRQAVEFRAANLAGTTTGQFTAIGVVEASVAVDYGAALTPNNLVDYLRGNQAQETTSGGTLRARSSVLGDIVNSEPVISSPRNDYGYGSFDLAGVDMFDGYRAYLTQKRTELRPNVVYVGANDGMFHALDGSNGRELFAYVPNGVLGKMGKLALPDRPYTTGRSFNHEYYVDGQVTVVDAKDTAGWKTVAIGATGAGGKSVFALDVSAATAVGTNEVMWEWNSVTDPDLGYSMGKPLVLPLENGSWGAVFSNGYGGAKSDPILYVVDVFSGNLIAKIRASDGDPGDDADADSNTTDPYNGLGQITAVDSDADGRVNYVYGGDLQGNLWKFDLSAATATSWDVFNFPAAGRVPLFTAVTGTERQPITGGIRISRGPGLGYSVFFGTGRYFINGDGSIAAPPQIQSLYGVLDNGTAAGGRVNLVAQTLAQVSDPGADGLPGTPDDTVIRTTSQNAVPYFGTSARRGWYIDLALSGVGTGERFIGTPRIQNGKVFFATFNPVGDSCEPGGTNLLYGLDLITGGGALTYVTQLPTNAPVSTTTGTGAVPLSSGAPITNISVLANKQTKPIDPTCIVGSPGWPACLTAGPTFEQCQVVIYPGALVLPRPCGRQSWRQLR